MVRLIAATKTSTDLRLTCKLDNRSSRLGKVVTDKQMDSMQIKRTTFHGDWNYEITQRVKL